MSLWRVERYGPERERRRTLVYPLIGRTLAGIVRAFTHGDMEVAVIVRRDPDHGDDPVAVVWRGEHPRRVRIEWPEPPDGPTAAAVTKAQQQIEVGFRCGVRASRRGDEWRTERV